MRIKYFFTNETTHVVDAQIDAVMDEMTRVGPSSEEYPKLVEHLKALHEIKSKDRRDFVSKDTMAIVGGNIALALLIIGFEKVHVPTSKAWGQMIRPKGPGIG